eukprot:CAMPEP_0181095332 /NCGR_PEP_ID=MMETSP1071-20121207/10462_1 /TAXON_ID=35127 /ORGANISM="Thalassiosira sp., Strain NH16" /LENGTH=139 /DNA_ID=CAMNT_0023177705 /DNA_START=151 /DNA_END=566 /DNA_ORIENTATION=+
MSSKQSKRAAREALKSARSGLAAGTSGLDRLEDAGFGGDADDDVYQEMGEEEYREYVGRQNEREDFVIDDDGLGYHDDGDYDIHELVARDEARQNPTSSQATNKNSNNALTKDALRRARRKKAAMTSAKGGNNGGEEKG